MPKINLLYIITKLELGGAQKQLLSLIRRLNKEKFNVSLFTAEEGLLVQEASCILGLTLNKSRYLERPLNPIKDFLALIEIYIFIKKHNIDIVHTHSSKAGILGRLAARFAGAKIILHTVHGWSFNDYQSNLKQNCFIWLERLTAAFTDRLIVVSKFDMVKGLKLGIGSSNKYAIINYGIDAQEFALKGQNIKEELGVPANNSLVMMISCLKPQKSPQDFIRVASLVAKELPEVKFVLVGDGILRRDIETLINKFNLDGKVILLGWRRDIPRLLSMADALVLTSLWEGLPITVLEAMFCARAVVATNTGGIAEIIKDGETGFLVEPCDIKKMSEKLIVLLGNEELRKAMGQKAKASLGTNFSIDNMLNATQRLYDALMSMQDEVRAYAN